VHQFMAQNHLNVGTTVRMRPQHHDSGAPAARMEAAEMLRGGGWIGPHRIGRGGDFIAPQAQFLEGPGSIFDELRLVHERSEENDRCSRFQQHRSAR